MSERPLLLRAARIRARLETRAPQPLRRVPRHTPQNQLPGAGRMFPPVARVVLQQLLRSQLLGGRGVGGAGFMETRWLCLQGRSSCLPRVTSAHLILPLSLLETPALSFTWSLCLYLQWQGCFVWFWFFKPFSTLRNILCGWPCFWFAFSFL